MFEDDIGNREQFSSEFVETLATDTASFTQIDMTLFLAIKSYHRKGGTIESFRRVVARALSETDWNNEPVDITPPAKNTSGGTTGIVSEDRRGAVPPARTQPANTGPSASVIDGMMRAKLGSADAIFDTFKVRDGRAIGDVCYGELARLETQDRIEAAVFAAIRKRGVAAHGTAVRDLIKPKLLETIIRNAREKHAA